MSITSTTSVNSLMQFSDKEIKLFATRGVTQNEIQSFEDIMEKAMNAGGYEKPKEFLHSLSKDDMKIVQKIHCLAEPVEIEPLSLEGAHNLLLPDSASKDLDDNRIVEIGAAKTRPFPPVNASDNVKDAWNEVTEGMPLKEKMIADAMFWAAELSANLKKDSSGKIIGFYEPNDPEYVNIYNQPGFTYNGLIDQYIETLETVKHSMSTQAYEQKKEFAELLKDTFTKHNVA